MFPFAFRSSAWTMCSQMFLFSWWYLSSVVSSIRMTWLDWPVHLRVWISVINWRDWHTSEFLRMNTKVTSVWVMLRACTRFQRYIMVWCLQIAREALRVWTKVKSCWYFANSDGLRTRLVDADHDGPTRSRSRWFCCNLQESIYQAFPLCCEQIDCVSVLERLGCKIREWLVIRWEENFHAEWCWKCWNRPKSM